MAPSRSRRIIKPSHRLRRKRPINLKNLNRDNLYSSVTSDIAALASRLTLQDNSNIPVMKKPVFGFGYTSVKKPSVFTFGAVSEALSTVEGCVASTPIPVTHQNSLAGSSTSQIRQEDVARALAKAQAIELSDDSDFDDDIEPDSPVDLSKLLGQRVMAEVQAVSWDQLSSLYLHSNYFGTRLYDSIGTVESENRLYAFSKEPVQVNQVFLICVKMPTSGKVFAGFTVRSPASLELGSLPQDAEELVKRPDYWIVADFDRTKAYRIVMKVKPGGEVLVLFGEQDFRSFSIDITKKLWLFVQSPTAADIILRTTMSTYNYVPPERPIPRVRTGMTAGVPHEEPLKEFQERALSELVYNCNWETSSSMYLSNYGCGTRVYDSLGSATIREQNSSFFVYSRDCVKDNQVYKISARRSNKGNQRLLYIGFTARNPTSVESSRLPTGPQLYERPDYWEFTCFDVDQAARVYMKMKPDGEVLVMFGEQDWRSFRVNRGAPLWLFIHGMSGVEEIFCRTMMSNYTYKKRQSKPVAPTPANIPSGGPSGAPAGQQCVVCKSSPVNAALVNCGHSCFCLPCAERVQTSTGQCPMCRARIERVVQLYL